MPATLTIRDESTGGKTLREFDLEVLTERITVRELIRSRVYQEVKDFNTRQPDSFHGLVQPTDAERTLNGFRLRKKRQIDWKKQFDEAIQAFTAGRILVLCNNQQLDDLEAEIEINPQTDVSFLQLTPLVGG